MEKSQIVDYYNSVYSSKDTRYSRLRELIPSNINHKWKVLDYGTGTGLLAHWLSSNYNCQVRAVDYSENELDKARETWKGDNNIDFLQIDKLPEEQYDIVFSIQVMEHVHNHGEYMNRVNKMTKMGGYYIVSLPNVSNIRFIFLTLISTNNRLRTISKDILDNYDKGMHHIHSWDPFHFINLMASCGFEFEEWTPTEGMALPFNFPIKYINKMNRTMFGRLSYTMAFRFKKVRDVHWDINA